MTIKELREANGLTQYALSGILKVPQSKISVYEGGYELPPLEVMMKIEQHFSVSATFNENTTIAKRFKTVQSLIELLQHYPIHSVVNFAAGAYNKESDPDKVINEAASFINDEELLYPPNFEK